MKRVLFEENTLDEVLAMFREIVRSEISQLKQAEKNASTKSVKMLNIEEAAKFLSLPIDTVRKLKDSENGIPHYKPGKRVLFRQSEIEEWLEKQRVLTISEMEAQLNNRLKTAKKKK